MVRDRVDVYAEQNRVGRAVLPQHRMPGNARNAEDGVISHLEMGEAIWRAVKARDRLVRKHERLLEIENPGCSALLMHRHDAPKDFVSQELFLPQHLRDLTFGVPALPLAGSGARR